ncbi:hypothetical protein P5673_006824 [Acropora cervicornis]|uniref:Uncharacterized protein n=1 Tax=Acropora cervicornis TaxID=6130 RepID=A0AAD9QWG5_ACRCE|nr:hypothetical protein P5673_006824 [Acropora cervicornis]
MPERAGFSLFVTNLYSDGKCFMKIFLSFEKALVITKEIGDGRGEIRSYGNLFISLGEYDKAKEYLEKALVIRIKIDDKQGEAAIDISTMHNIFQLQENKLQQQIMAKWSFSRRLLEFNHAHTRGRHPNASIDSKSIANDFKTCGWQHAKCFHGAHALDSTVMIDYMRNLMSGDELTPLMSTSTQCQKMCTR